MTLKGRNRRLLKALTTLRQTYGEPYDIVGGFEVEDKFWKLLATDSQQVKYDILMNILQYFSDMGYVDDRGNRKSFEDDAIANTIFLSCGVKGI